MPEQIFLLGLRKCDKSQQEPSKGFANTTPSEQIQQTLSNFT
jgi:hypothetical protein